MKLKKTTILTICLLLVCSLALADKKFSHMEKGWELYSWKKDNKWYFTLIIGTNRNKTYEEIILAKHNPDNTVEG